MRRLTLALVCLGIWSAAAIAAAPNIPGGYDSMGFSGFLRIVAVVAGCLLGFLVIILLIGKIGSGVGHKLKMFLGGALVGAFLMAFVMQFIDSTFGLRDFVLIAVAGLGLGALAVWAG
jgi:hypothetical protein